MTTAVPCIALHGGAGSRAGTDYALEIAHMRTLIETGRDLLLGGGSALDVVTWTVMAMERSGHYIAGRGSSPNLEGDYELDACIMDGSGQQTGAVAALQGYDNPALVAREVMLRTSHVLLAGAGAARFAQSLGLAPIEKPEEWFTRACQDEGDVASMIAKTPAKILGNNHGRCDVISRTSLRV